VIIGRPTNVTAADGSSRAVGTVVAGYSGSEGAARALRRAAELSNRAGKLVVVHVLEPPQSISSRIEGVAPEDLQWQADVLREGGELADVAQGQLETVAALGDPGDELLRIAVEHRAEVVVVVRGRMPRISLLHQSVSERVVREASVCVLVVP
jgi:nucleotide-binding universal stress UspA family protein